MAINGLNSIESNTGVSIGNRNDFCYLCALELDTSKGEKHYNTELKKLKNILEGQKVFKINRGGSVTTICKEHIALLNKELNGGE